MPTTATDISPVANAAGTRKAARFFSDEFIAVALFSAIGLLVSLLAVISGEQGVWI